MLRVASIYARRPQIADGWLFNVRFPPKTAARLRPIEALRGQSGMAATDHIADAQIISYCGERARNSDWIRNMKTASLIIGVAAMLMGLLWVGQGTGLVHWPASSFMIDQRPWVIRGGILAAVGFVLALVATSRRR
jgi:hypothetical protein